MKPPAAPGPTPLSGTATTGGWQPLPPKLLEDGATRLAWLAGASAVLIVIVELGQYWLQPELEDVFKNPLNRLVTLATVLMAVGMVALHRNKLITAQAMFGIGASFQVLMAVCISLIETSKPMVGPVLGISALGPWIFVVALAIPNRPIWTLLVGLAEAATWPAAYFFNVARFEYTPLAWNYFSVWPGINFLLAILAFVICRRLYGTAIAAQRAAELGSYRLVAPIGEGGMGEVWQATHQMLARKAAIKLVKPEGLSARQAEVSAKRFRREANVIAGLQSPHTVYLYDFGSSQDGRFYYVMELLDGISLQTLVTKFGPQPANRVAHIIRQMCLSLEEAHQNALVHRDLKPSNVMLCKVALTYDFVKVLDFGLAKSVRQSEEVTQLTMEGMASGTPGYIAPEVALGDPVVDHRADLYAVGCVAYFLLTGTLVFYDSNPVTMALKHVQAAPELPSTRTEMPIPAALEEVVMRCLAKKPEQRPPSARAIADAVTACGLTDWTDAVAEGWWERHLPASSSLRSFAPASIGTPHVVQKA
jgi:serine/threonine-protein kinase